jgi:hypothetical protein
MPVANEFWSEKLENILSAYDGQLVRQIAARLLKTRNQWPLDELRQRIREAMGNAPVIDRRLKDLPQACVRLLGAIDVSGRPGWKIGRLMEMLATLGHAEGLAPVQKLLEEGLLFPVDPPADSRVRQFNYWFSNGAAQETRLFAHPQVTRRARLWDLGLPELPPAEPARGDAREADGLEWPIRLAVVWQQVDESPLRRTMQKDFFKRDLQRLRTDPILAATFADHVADIPDAGALAVAWAIELALLQSQDVELRAGAFSDDWTSGLSGLIERLWQALLDVDTWDPINGWNIAAEATNPFPSVYPMVLALMARQPDKAWVSVSDIESWLVLRHPFWGGVNSDPGWCNALIAGLFYHLKLVQVSFAQDQQILVRLSPLGRKLSAGDRPVPEAPPFPQTLIVQPNCEMIVFRQGLTPGLLADLTRLARWKSIGTACQMELNAERVYRGLESGLDLDEVLNLLQRHGMRPMPDNVVDALRTWAGKRERIVVYDQVALIEFATAADLVEAQKRGLITHRLTDRLGLVRNEDSLDYRQFRLTGTRDYGSKPEQCLHVADDGLTLTVDASRSDLLLETELQGVTESVDSTADRRVFRLTRASLRKALENGQSLESLNEWMMQRAGQPLSPAARLLAASDGSVGLQLETCLVLHVPSSELADGLLQWPESRGLIKDRLGPMALVIAEADVSKLQQVLSEIQQRIGDKPV